MGPRSATVVRRRLPASGGAQVGLDGPTAAAPVGVGSVGGDLLGAVPAAAGDGHAHAFGGEGAGDGEAQAAGGRGHEGGLSADSEIHQSSPPW